MDVKTLIWSNFHHQSEIVERGRGRAKLKLPVQTLKPVGQILQLTSRYSTTIQPFYYSNRYSTTIQPFY
jgi:hypothetical protein